MADSPPNLDETSADNSEAISSYVTVLYEHYKSEDQPLSQILIELRDLELLSRNWELVKKILKEKYQINEPIQ